jgi:CRP-like cAMP-binding protein
MFAPLSLATKERVASSLVPISVSAGEVVIRAGDQGDRFYIVGDGELDIDAGGRHRPRVQPTTSARSLSYATSRERRR